jgi:uncharacterized protein Veg
MSFWLARRTDRAFYLEFSRLALYNPLRHGRKYMDAVRQIEVVGRIRSDLQGLMGTRMRLKANMGRSKIVEREGVLEETHPSLFVVKVDEKRDRTARVSYSYVDILTGTVELTHCESGDSVFPWLN